MKMGDAISRYDLYCGYTCFLQSMSIPSEAHSKPYHPPRTGPSISSKVLLMSRFPIT